MRGGLCSLFVLTLSCGDHRKLAGSLSLLSFLRTTLSASLLEPDCRPVLLQDSVNYQSKEGRISCKLKAPTDNHRDVLLGISLNLLLVPQRGDHL